MMKKMYVFILCLIVFAGCSQTDNEPVTEGKSLITAVTRSGNVEGIVSEYETASDDESQYGSISARLAFTGDDIEWFNPRTREIRFRKINSIPVYARIEMKVGEETVFTIVAHISHVVNRAYNNLVLFYDMEKNAYFLNDNWPDYWDPEGTRRNAEKRAPGWAKFLKQLKKEGKLK
ncbi:MULTISPECIES: hypothetical protein [Bacteroidales]|uniref:Lipoprotein n=1 Tax=Porphyromonas gulae TaxID=111105 RepID=A0A0A2FP26_9PORP|nr:MULTISPECIES: hypothetical protein [Porphyromonas]KGL56425.1 hypothetical protein HQ50_02215 [Porphyromonas sp. COT-052 OH4946]KGN92778.1 hypothetical protein HR15_01925 [Porphyromonas gulae]